MRWLAVALVLAGCTERNLAVGEAFDASAIVADLGTVSHDLAMGCALRQCFMGGGSLCPMAGGQLEVAAGMVKLKFCRCLHGCGPGIDGTIELVVQNYSAQSHAIHLEDVSYTSVDGATSYDDSSAKLVRPYSCVGEPDPWDGKVIVGALEHYRIDEHFDVMTPLAGQYQLRVQLSVDGQSIFYELGSFQLDDDTSCF